MAEFTESGLALDRKVNQFQANKWVGRGLAFGT
jgi:hypothetical protein